MIDLMQGNLLEADVEALVNTVNCVGVMGKGIALQFKHAFPDNFRHYERACRAHEVRLGQMFTVPTDRLNNPKYIINFPTKNHWRGKSRIEDIESGLAALVQDVERLSIRSIAIPALGCSNGGLEWADVAPRIMAAFEGVSTVKVLLYEPFGAPKAASMPVATTKPSLTRSRALLIKLFELYRMPGYSLTLLEIQKLAYFLQASGEPLRLHYVKHKYGPYAENLNHVLQRLEGHCLRGYGDRSGRTDVHLLPTAVDEAQTLLERHSSNQHWRKNPVILSGSATSAGISHASLTLKTVGMADLLDGVKSDANRTFDYLNGALDDDGEALRRLNRIGCLIEGFETPAGMELLATVHWVMVHNQEAAADPSVAVNSVQRWSQRKQNLFSPQQIGNAWQRLYDQQWVTAAQQVIDRVGITTNV